MTEHRQPANREDVIPLADERDLPAPRGYIVLAAFQPDPVLLRRQLDSIRAQTVRDYVCKITCDGDAERIALMVKEITEDDPRFVVLGYDERLGFYRNFERGLDAVPANATWIGLSDQDDDWRPDKLERMIPHLEDVAMVSGQARVVAFPSGEVLSESTGRLDLGVKDYLLNNQFTGGMSLLRRDVLEVALPFPRLRTPAEVHDHWLAVCAHFVGGTRVIPDIVQDYMQHAANVIGEAQESGFSPKRSWANLSRITRRFEPKTTPSALARVIYRVGVGWREVMVATLAERVPPGEPEIEELRRLFGSDRRLVRTFPYLLRAVKGNRVSGRSAVEYLAGWVIGWFLPRSRR